MEQGGNSETAIEAFVETANLQMKRICGEIAYLKVSEIENITECRAYMYIHGQTWKLYIYICILKKLLWKFCKLMSFKTRNKEIFYVGHAATLSWRRAAKKGSVERGQGTEDRGGTTLRGQTQDEQIVSTHFCVKPTTINTAGRRRRRRRRRQR